MHCMKCGVEIPEDQVFCSHCLAVMEEYPIRPGTHIHLPKQARQELEGKKPQKKRRAPSQEEQLASLRQKVFRLRITAAVMAFLLFTAGGFLVSELLEDDQAPDMGWNYTIDTSMND